MADIDIEKINDSKHLLDILIQMENVLDSLDLYCYKNWFSGEVIEGPIVRRHWVTMSLLYPYNKMPDPRAALRLLKHGVQVEFSRMKREESATVNTKEHEPNHSTNWMVRLTMPRHLLDAMEEADLEIYDDEVNPDDVTAAMDIGLDNESQFQTDEQMPPTEQQPLPAQPNQPQPQGNPNAPPPQRF